ncbi:tetratricopeptide repeat protein [Streptomyces sp. NPDC048669]|uniref:tetratricopeptide repeat protein n=1 Tax=Streptomyces sp. NPDC048669 TaxID=3155267 RepID=UPI00344132F0
MATDQTGIACDSWGMPDVAQRDGKAVEAAQLEGKLNPGSGFVGNQYVMDLLQQPPRWSPDGTSPWGGMSGAAVFCDRLLIGVVASDRAHSGGGQLNVVPAYVLHAKKEPAFRATLAEHGAGADHGLEAAELQLLTDSAQVPGRSGSLSSPAALLDARHQTVPFHGREELLGELENWCNAEDAFGARLLHGPGGQGKTRLAHRLAAQLAPDGWVVLWPKANAAVNQLTDVRHVSKPLLVILDYAEARVEQLAALVEAASDHTATSPLRLLLLARAKGEWWGRAISAARLDDPTKPPTHFLDPLEDSPDDRADHYSNAAGAMARALSRNHCPAGHDWLKNAAGLRPPTLDQSPYSNVLTLQMTALVDLLDTIDPPGATDAVGDHPSDASPAADVEDRLLRHESRYWKQNADSQGLTPQPLSLSTLETALAAAHLVGAADREQADRLWQRLPVLKDQPRDCRNRVTTWISALYPPPAGTQLPWGTLQPDRLAERHVGHILRDNPALAEQLLKEADQTQVDRLLTVYSRAAAHPVFRERLAGQLTALCRSRLDLGASVIATATRTDHPDPLITALTKAISDPDTSLADLETLSTQLPRSSQRLAAPAVHLSQALTRRYRAILAEAGLKACLKRNTYNTYLRDLATSLHYLSMRLGEAGRRKEALAAIEEAVRIRRGLVRLSLRGSRNRNAYLQDLAQSLNNLSADLSMAGRENESRAASKKSNTIRKSLEKADPNAYLPDIAESLNNLSIRQRHVGQRDDRLYAVKRAIEHYRGLAEANPTAYLPKLAMSLNNLSNRLGEVGRRKEALAAIEEAVRIRRGLAEANPDAYLPDLALSLNNLSIQQWKGGQRDDGLAAIKEATEHYRGLAKANPDAYLPDLAESVYVLAVRQGQGGQRDDGLAAIEEAVKIHRHLARTNPPLFEADLKKSLEVEARLKDLGQ